MKFLFVVCCTLLSCYIQDASGQARLIGVTPPAADPNSVAILFNSAGSNICSGVLIHAQWVLTSAVCGLRRFNEEMRVNIGGQIALDFNNGYHIKDVYIHPNFNGWSLQNDIALARLVSPAPTTIRTVRVSDNDDNIVGTRVYALGYGNNGENLADGTLNQQRLSILDNMICEQYPVPINCDKLCTYESRACEGDQGGPLLSEDKRTCYGLISITQDQAAMCGGDKIIPVTTYTRVSAYRPWIINTTNIHYL